MRISPLGWAAAIFFTLALPACGDPYEDLVQACANSPKRMGTPELMDTFRRLREQPDPRAIPALQRVLEHSPSLHAFYLATGLALCALDLPEARALLERHVLRPDFRVSWSSDPFVWKHVTPDLRDRFLESWLFRSLSTDLALHLDVRSQVAGGVQRLTFDIEARNTSEQPYRIPIRGIYVGKMLQFRASDGRYVRTVERGIYDREGPPPPVSLAPGAIHCWTIEAWVYRKPAEAAAERRRSRHGYAPKTEVYVETRWDPGPQGEGDVGYDTGQPGAFDVFAWIESSGYERNGAGEDPPLWRGRALSNTVRVTLLPPP